MVEQRHIEKFTDCRCAFKSKIENLSVLTDLDDIKRITDEFLYRISIIDGDFRIDIDDIDDIYYNIVN